MWLVTLLTSKTLFLCFCCEFTFNLLSHDRGNDERLNLGSYKFSGSCKLSVAIQHDWQISEFWNTLTIQFPSYRGECLSGKIVLLLRHRKVEHMDDRAHSLRCLNLFSSRVKRVSNSLNSSYPSQPSTSLHFKITSAIIFVWKRNKSNLIQSIQ